MTLWLIGTYFPSAELQSQPDHCVTNVGDKIGCTDHLDGESARTTRAQVRERLLGLVSELLRIPSERIAGTAALDGELRMESVAFVELQVSIEDTYQIEIDPIRVVRLNQFDAIVDYIYSCVARSASPVFR